MNNTAAVVVTYNRKDMLRECITRLCNQVEYKCDVLVIDNASTDGTHEYIQDLLSDTVKYINTGKNLGGAGGFSFGLKKAGELGYEYAWLMDDDTYVETDALKELFRADKELDGKYGFLSSIAYWKDGSLCNMNRQRTALTGKLECFDHLTEPVIMATFVSFFVKMDVVREVGLPISEFFIWADDFEYSRRISKKYPSYAVPGSKVVHWMGSNAKVGIEQDSKDRLWRYQYLYRNEVYVYRREGVKGIAFLFARYVLHSMRVLFKAKDAKLEKFKVIQKSFWSGWKFHPEIERI